MASEPVVRRNFITYAMLESSLVVARFFLLKEELLKKNESIKLKTALGIFFLYIF